MTEEKKDSKSKIVIIILIIVIVLLLLAGTITVVVLLRNDNSKTETDNVQTSIGSDISTKSDNGVPILDYDDSAVALTPEDLEKQFSEMQDKVNAGQVSLEFQNAAFSENGTDFTCYLANSESNTEDMYFNIYRDGSFSEQIYLSGLLPPGKVIGSFQSEIHFDPGKYEVVVLFTTVSNDHKTITSQTPVVITLEVG